MRERRLFKWYAILKKLPRCNGISYHTERITQQNLSSNAEPKPPKIGGVTTQVDTHTVRYQLMGFAHVALVQYDKTFHTCAWLLYDKIALISPSIPLGIYSMMPTLNRKEPHSIQNSHQLATHTWYTLYMIHQNTHTRSARTWIIQGRHTHNSSK